MEKILEVVNFFIVSFKALFDSFNISFIEVLALLNIPVLFKFVKKKLRLR